MSKFMLILYDRPADFANVSPEDIQRIIEEYNAWGRGLADRGKAASKSAKWTSDLTSAEHEIPGRARGCAAGAGDGDGNAPCACRPIAQVECDAARRAAGGRVGRPRHLDRLGLIAEPQLFGEASCA